MCLFSRVVFVTVLTCAAVVPFMGLHAAKDYPTVAPVDAGEHPFVRSYRRFGLLSSGSGQQTGPSSETAERRRNPIRDASPVQYLQPSLLSKGHLGYNHNTQQHNRPHLGPVSHVHRGQHLEGAKLATGTSTHSVPQLSRMNHNQFFHMKSQNGGPPRFAAPHNGNSQPWHLPIIRKSQQGWPIPQRSASQVQKADGNDQFPRSGASTQPESRSAHINWESPDDSPTPFRSSGYWSSQTHSQGHASDNRETNAGASAVRTSKFPSYLNQRSFVAASVSNSKGSSVAEPEKTTSPLTQLSQGRFPQNSNEKTSYKRVQSSLLWHSHTTDAPKGVNTQNLQQNAYKGRDFDQGIRSNFKIASKGDHPASVIFRAPQKNTLTSYDARNVKSGVADTSRNMQPNENGHQKERFNHNKGFASSSDLKKNKELSKEANLELIGFRLVRPSRLQKYSFEQRIAPSTSSRDIFRHSSSEVLDTTPKLSAQEYRSESAGDIESERSGALSGAGQNEETKEGELAKSADVSKSASLTRVKPQPEIDGNAQWEDAAAKDLKYKAVTYDDIIGSASFSSVTPAKNAQGDGHFEKPPTRTTATEETANINRFNSTEEDSVGGKILDFTRGEAESELGISDWSVKEEEREAKSVPREPPSDPEENIESDSLLELDYLRTSTGNVSFQSLNLNV